MRRRHSNIVSCWSLNTRSLEGHQDLDSLTNANFSLYTLAVYMGSAIYTPSTTYVMEKWGVSAAAASLGLALYVLGCKSHIRYLPLLVS